MHIEFGTLRYSGLFGYGWSMMAQTQSANAHALTEHIEIVDTIGYYSRYFAFLGR